MASRARVDLTAEERTFLVRGLDQWGGPAMPTDEIAHLLGFTDVDALDREAASSPDASNPVKRLNPATGVAPCWLPRSSSQVTFSARGSIGRSRLASRMRSQFGSCAAFSGSSLASLACLDGPAA